MSTDTEAAAGTASDTNTGPGNGAPGGPGTCHGDSVNSSAAQAQQHISYQDAGVDTAAGAAAVDAIKASVRRTARPEVIGGLGGFGGLFSAAAFKKMDDPVLVSGTDGVGTKLRLARAFDRHGSVGIDLVAMCVNDILAAGAEPLFFLDYIAIGHIEPGKVAGIVSGIADGCRQAGCALVGGEMAEHPGVMAADDYDLAGFAVGVAERAELLTPDRVKEGDVILGLASSGVHSNGYSLVRRVLFEDLDRPDFDPAPYLQPQERLDGASLAEAALAPTRIYVKSVLPLLKNRGLVHGLAHITGGGISENLDRVLPKTLDAQVERGSWPVPPVIQLAVERAGLTEDEAHRTFNMGVGMCVICDPAYAPAISQELQQAGEKVFRLGRIGAGSGKVVYR